MRTRRAIVRCMAAVAAWAAGAAAPAAEAPQSADVIVYGGTAAGVIAAVQAARMDRSVILVSPARHLGGLTTGGLGMTDFGNQRVIGGLAREFYRRVKKHYDGPGAWTRGTAADFQWYEAKDDAMWRFEPHVAEEVIEGFVAGAKIPVVRGERLDLAPGKGVEMAREKEGLRITAIRMESGRVFRGRMFIDATYEGDVMARAGVSYHIGRESNATHGETINGVQLARALKHQFPPGISPYVRPGDPSSGLLPRVSAEPPAADGSGDRKIQAYCFRMCLTDDPAIRVPFPKPEGYDARHYELLLRVLASGWREVFQKFDPMPNHKTDTNNHGPFSTDNIGMNYDYPDGDYATRERIWREHEAYQKGLMWFLANDPRVPGDVRTAMAKWGLAKDEFADTGHWPHQLYVREARRMIASVVMTEAYCRGDRVAEDSVGMGAYNMDSHNVQRIIGADGCVRNEGDLQIGVKPYPISYRSIVPKAPECSNLLVPVCLSASHIAYGSIRMEPVFMVLGQSAATAASLALDQGVDVQSVDYARLRERLLADGQVLALPAPAKGRP